MSCCYFSGRTRRSSIASLRALKEGSGLMKSQSFSSIEKPFDRSQSMLDLHREIGNFPTRRSYSTANLQRSISRENAFSDRESMFSDVSSPAQSELSIRTAPQMSTTGKTYYHGNYPRLASSLSPHSRSGIRRSASQPNLRNSLTNTGTYPQGILKRNETSAAENARIRRQEIDSPYLEKQYFELEASPQNYPYFRQVSTLNS